MKRDNFERFGIPREEATYVTPGMPEYKQELEDYCDQFHAMVMEKRAIKKEKERYLTRPSAGGEMECQEEQISMASKHYKEERIRATQMSRSEAKINIFKSGQVPQIDGMQNPLGSITSTQKSNFT